MANQVLTQKDYNLKNLQKIKKLRKSAQINADICSTLGLDISAKYWTKKEEEYDLKEIIIISHIHRNKKHEGLNIW